MKKNVYRILRKVVIFMCQVFIIGMKSFFVEFVWTPENTYTFSIKPRFGMKLILWVIYWFILKQITYKLSKAVWAWS